MSYLWNALAIGLALLLLVSGVAKLRDQSALRDELPSFGVPRALGPTVAVALPLIEVCAGVLILIPATRSAGGVLSAIILSFVLVAVCYAMRNRPSRPLCHCFGSMYSRPVDRSTVLRLVALIVTSIVVAWPSKLITGECGTTCGIGSLNVLRGLVLLLLLSSAAQWRVSQHLIRQQAILLSQSERVRPTVGVRPGAGEAPGVLGDVSAATSHHDFAVVFVGHQCSACVGLIDDLVRSDMEPARPYVVVSDSAEIPGARLNGAEAVVVDEDNRLQQMFGIQATPTAIIISHDQLALRPRAEGVDAVMESLGISRLNSFQDRDTSRVH
jgi:uncharacterized membrane protein YphA (DoxX/SURF4 family)